MSLFVLALFCSSVVALPAQSIQKKLSLIVPEIEFVSTPLPDALEFFQVRSMELDPEKQGFNIILSRGDMQSVPEVTMKLKGVSFAEALGYVADLTGLKLSVEPHAVVLSPPAEEIKTAARKYQPSRATGEKLKNITIPSVELVEAPLRDAFEFLRIKSEELDIKEPDPAKKGVNFLIRPAPEGTGEPYLTVKFKDVPLIEAIRYFCLLANYEFAVNNNTVIVSPKAKEPKSAESEDPSQ